MFYFLIVRKSNTNHDWRYLLSIPYLIHPIATCYMVIGSWYFNYFFLTKKKRRLTVSPIIVANSIPLGSPWILKITPWRLLHPLRLKSQDSWTSLYFRKSPKYACWLRKLHTWANAKKNPYSQAYVQKEIIVLLERCCTLTLRGCVSPDDYIRGLNQD